MVKDNDGEELGKEEMAVLSMFERTITWPMHNIHIPQIPDLTKHEHQILFSLPFQRQHFYMLPSFKIKITEISKYV